MSLKKYGHLWIDGKMFRLVPEEELKVLIQPKEHSKEDKPVLFTTEDGVGIEKYGWAFYVEEDNNWGIVSYSCIDIPRPERKYFSTKEKAEEYILMNKPIVSLIDILSVWDKDHIKTPRYYMDAPIFVRIKELAKSKLK
jgi:hypothetical protein